jgi:hypothetical protein
MKTNHDRPGMPDKLNRQGRQTTDRESEGCIVPLKPGNSGGGKAAERLSYVGQGIDQTQSWTLDDNWTSLQIAATSCGKVTVGSRMR